MKTRQVRPRFHFEHTFGSLHSQELIMTAIRKTVESGQKPFVLCTKCNFFQVKNWNGGHWYEDSSSRSEAKQVVGEVRLRMEEWQGRKMDHLLDTLFEKIECPVCEEE